MVYVPRLGGFVSPREFFERLGKARDGESIAAGRELLRNCPPEARPDLIPHLVPILEGKPDAATSFARKALDDMTGLRRGDAGAYQRWHRRWRELREIGEARDRSRFEVALAIVQGDEPVPLKETALWALGRAGDPWVIEELIGMLGNVHRSLRAPLHQALCDLSGHRPSVEPRRWEECIGAWRGWWATEAVTVRASRSLAKHLDALEDAESPADTERALAGIVAAGTRAVPAILERMEADAYSFHLVEALERITGRRLGPAYEPWAAWWAEQ
jgi:hypothetical protein